MMSPINNTNTNATDTNLLLNEACVKSYTKSSKVNCLNKVKKSLTNSRIIKSLPNGVIGCLAGASIGFITIEVLDLIIFSLTSNNEKQLTLADMFYNDTMIFIKVLYTVVCAIIGYCIEVENYHKSNKYRI
jgi:hypothetical protein